MWDFPLNKDAISKELIEKPDKQDAKLKITNVASVPVSTQPESVEDVDDGHTKNQVQEEPKSNNLLGLVVISTGVDNCDEAAVFLSRATVISTGVDITGVDITTTSDGVDEGMMNPTLEKREC